MHSASIEQSISFIKHTFLKNCVAALKVIYGTSEYPYFTPYFDYLWFRLVSVWSKYYPLLIRALKKIGHPKFGVENSSTPNKIWFWWFEMLKLGFAGAGRQKTLKVVQICIESFIFTFLLLASINLDGRFLNPKFNLELLTT